MSGRCCFALLGARSQFYSILRRLWFLIWFGFLQGEAGIVLELPDQKARVFLVPIALT
jgi:hypothetical protein